jgi:single-strand DNA-binding protein
VLQGFNSQLTMLDRAGDRADFSASDSGADFGSAGPTARERKPALAGAGAGGKGDLDDEIPF